MPATAIAKPVSPLYPAGDPSLVLAMPFVEKGGLTVKDYSGQNNNGTLNGGVSWTDGPWGRCLSFDGATGYVLASPFATLAPPFSAVGWVNPSSLTGNRACLAHDSGANNGWRLFLSDTGQKQLEFVFGGVAAYMFNTLPLLAVNVWQFVAVSISGNGGTVTGYLGIGSGSLYSQTLAVGSMSGSPNRLIIGDDVFGSIFIGLQDSLSLYKRALSPGEIAALYADSFRMYRRKPIILSSKKSGLLLARRRAVA